MKYLLVAALLVTGCKKGGGAAAGGDGSTKAKKPDVVLSGKAMSRIRDLELQCYVEVDPDKNLLWTSVKVINHGTTAHYLPSPTEKIWMIDQAGRVFYGVGGSVAWNVPLPKDPVYATMAPSEVREWTISGAKSPAELSRGPAQDFKCAVSQGPDGTHFLQAGARAVGSITAQ